MSIMRACCWIFLLALLAVFVTAHAEPLDQPRRLAELFEAIDRATQQDGNYGLTYASSILSLNPCLRADSELGQDIDASNFTGARSVFPAKACDDPDFKRLLPQLFILQGLALAQTRQPMDVSAAIDGNRNALRACADVECAVAHLRRSIPQFAAYWRAAQRSVKPARMPALVKIDKPREWVATHATPVLAQMDSRCAGAALSGWFARAADQTRTAEFSCDLGGTEAPSWTLALKPSGWTPILAVESMGDVVELRTSASPRFPDLKNTVRVNMGEHPATVYRYDGTAYVEILSLDIQSSDFGEVAIHRIGK